MISLDKAVVARLTSHTHRFEILVDPEKALEAKERPMAVSEWVAANEVYKDASKGDKANEDTLKEAFGTLAFDEIALKIIQKGEIQVTTEQRKAMQADKRKQIVAAIARNAIDPRTNMPHPPSRIDKAIDEAKIHIDPLKSTQRQMDEVLKKIRIILPLKFASVRVEVRIPAQFSGKAYGLLNDVKKTKEEWKNDGSFVTVVEMPAGMQVEFYDKLNSATHGSVETKLLETF